MFSYYINALKKYAVFNGRSTRKEFWMFNLCNFIIVFTIGFIFSLISMDIDTINGISTIYGLFMFVPNLSIGFRRLHDGGYNGWWFLFPVVNLIACCAESQQGENKYDQNDISLTKVDKIKGNNANSIAIEDLEKLANLKERGLITEDEFNIKKKQFFEI